MLQTFLLITYIVAGTIATIAFAHVVWLNFKSTTVDTAKKLKLSCLLQATFYFICAVVVVHIQLILGIDSQYIWVCFVLPVATSALAITLFIEDRSTYKKYLKYVGASARW